MKKIIPALVVLLLSVNAFGQKALLALNEDNKYIYYRTEVCNDAATLAAKRIAAFIKARYPEIKLKEGGVAGTAFTGNGKKVLYKSSIVSHEEGEIDFDVQVELKDGKYRFWFTDFRFTPYQRNRYDVYVPITGISTPLEAASKFKKADLDRYLDETGAYCKHFGDELKAWLSASTAATVKQDTLKKISTKSW